jgi:hypothetical protein
MKNIIYTIIDKNFYKLFKYFYYSLRKVNPEIELLCITPKDLEIKFKDVLQYKIEDFDFKYSGKYKIVEWPEFENYDNYIYLDTDILFLEDPQDLFLEIEKDQNKIHSVRENHSLNNASLCHNYNGTIFEQDSPSFNAGNFGFNKILKSKFKDFLIYVEENKSKASLYDQPLFNIYFYNQITESFSKYIELFEHVKPIEPKIVHLFRSFYSIKGKEQIYKRHFRKETRGDILFHLPQKSNVGLFNCGDYFEKESIKYMIEGRKKEISVFKNNYTVNNEFYDYIYIDSASSINELVDIIRKIYPKVKGGGIISSVMAGETGKNILKNFITKSGLDFFQCYEDDVFFTIKL